jgi:CRP-like cAMP-binding protein
VSIDAFATLRAAPLLRGFTEVGVRILAGAVQRRTVGRGAYVFRSGEAATALAFIARGTVHLAPREGGAPIGELGPGESLGGLALLSGGEHLISALAAVDVELFELSVSAFRRLGQERPQAGLKLMLALATDLGERLHDARVPLREFLLWQMSKR